MKKDELDNFLDELSIDTDNNIGFSDNKKSPIDIQMDVPNNTEKTDNINTTDSVDNIDDNDLDDINELVNKYSTNDKTLTRLVNKITNRFLFRKTNLKPINKIQPLELQGIDNYKKGKIEVTIDEYSTSINFEPSAVSGDDDFIKSVDGEKKEISKFVKYIWDKENIKDDIKYIIPITEGQISIINYKQVNKNKLWRIWKKHDGTYNIYVGDVIVGKKDNLLYKIDDNEKEVIVEVSDMAKNIGIWGQMGSGKSVLIRNLLNSALAKSENMFNFLILEKEVDFLNYFKFRGILFNDAVGNMNIERLYSLFVYLALEYKRRNYLFNKMGVAHIRAYNQKVPPEERLPLLILLIDEYKELRDTLKKQSMSGIDLDKNFGESLGSLLQVSRASGILAWVATQQATDERGIHLGVRNNISTGFVGTTFEGSRFSALTTIQRKNLNILNKGDFYTFGTIGKNLIRCPFWDANDIDNPDFYSRMPLKDNWQDYQDATTIREFSNQYIIETIEKIANELNMDKFTIKEELFRSYHVSIEWITSLKGLRKLALILFINIFLEWFEKARDMILNSTNVPEDFELQSIIAGLKANNDYKPFSLLFDYMLYIYELNYSDFIKQNFKFSARKKIIEEGSEEEKEQLANFFNQKVMDMMDYKLKDINI